MAEFESERRPTIPRDFRSGNPRRVTRQDHGVSFFYCDVIAGGFRYAGRHYCTNVNVISVSMVLYITRRPAAMVSDASLSLRLWGTNLSAKCTMQQVRYRIHNRKVAPLQVRDSSVLLQATLSKLG